METGICIQSECIMVCFGDFTLHNFGGKKVLQKLEKGEITVAILKDIFPKIMKGEPNDIKN